MDKREYVKFSLIQLLVQFLFNVDFINRNLKGQKLISDKLMAVFNLSDEETIAFLQSIRFDLRQPNEEQLGDFREKRYHLLKKENLCCLTRLIYECGIFFTRKCLRDELKLKKR